MRSDTSEAVGAELVKDGINGPGKLLHLFYPNAWPMGRRSLPLRLLDAEGKTLQELDILWSGSAPRGPNPSTYSMHIEITKPGPSRWSYQPDPHTLYITIPKTFLAGSIHDEHASGRVKQVSINGFPVTGRYRALETSESYLLEVPGLKPAPGKEALVHITTENGRTASMLYSDGTFNQRSHRWLQIEEEGPESISKNLDLGLRTGAPFDATLLWVTHTEVAWYFFADLPKDQQRPESGSAKFIARMRQALKDEAAAAHRD